MNYGETIGSGNKQVKLAPLVYELLWVLHWPSPTLHYAWWQQRGDKGISKGRGEAESGRLGREGWERLKAMKNIVCCTMHIVKGST